MERERAGLKPGAYSLKRKRRAGGEAQWSMGLLKQVDLIVSIGAPLRDAAPEKERDNAEAQRSRREDRRRKERDETQRSLRRGRKPIWRAASGGGENGWIGAGLGLGGAWF
jgi:hypothetical protein